MGIDEVGRYRWYITGVPYNLSSFVWLLPVQYRFVYWCVFTFLVHIDSIFKYVRGVSKLFFFPKITLLWRLGGRGLATWRLFANKMSVYTDDTVWNRASGEIYDHPATQYEHGITADTREWQVKSNGDLPRTSNLHDIRGVTLCGEGGSNLTSKWRYFGFWRRPLTAKSEFLTGEDE